MSRSTAKRPSTKDMKMAFRFVTAVGLSRPKGRWVSLWQPPMGKGRGHDSSQHGGRELDGYASCFRQLNAPFLGDERISNKRDAPLHGLEQRSRVGELRGDVEKCDDERKDLHLHAEHRSAKSTDHSEQLHVSPPHARSATQERRQDEANQRAGAP